MHQLLNLKTKKTIRLAEDIGELTGDQYLYYLDLVLQMMVGEIADVDVIKRKLFVKLTDLKLSFNVNFFNPDANMEVWADLTDKINLLDSFFDIDETDPLNKVYHMHVKSGVNLLPRWRNRKGPADMLSNITWGEFVTCLNALKMINIAQEEEDVEEIESNTVEIFETLYKNPRPLKGGKKEKNPQPQKESKKYKKEVIPDTVLFHALTYFSYVYELITTVPIPINGEEIDFSIIWKGDGGDDEDKDDKSGWAGILFSIAETGIFGKTTDVNNSELYDVLLYLYRQKIKEIKDKKNSKNNGNGKSE